MRQAAATDKTVLVERRADADADARALRQLTVLVLAGLACTVLILAFLILASLQAVGMIDGASMQRERTQVSRAIAAMPGGVNEITLDAMATTLDLTDARLTMLGKVTSAEISTSVGGDRVAAWTPHLIGHRTFGIVAPLRILAGVIFSLIVALIGWRVHVVGRGLDRRRAAASHLALTDGLTGLANRLAFDAELERRRAVATAGGASFVLLMADLDDFKAINDRFGHGVGDRALQAVAHHLRDAANPGDMVARIGGDEFAILCSGAGLDTMLGGLRQRIAAPLDLDGHSVAVAASIGVARSSDFPDTPLTQAADAALYRAKRIGGGVAELAVPEPARRYAA